jgi:hypothetical protein
VRPGPRRTGRPPPGRAPGCSGPRRAAGPRPPPVGGGQRLVRPAGVEERGPQVVNRRRQSRVDGDGLPERGRRRGVVPFPLVGEA